jgi:hypothetical protein
VKADGKLQVTTGNDQFDTATNFEPKIQPTAVEYFQLEVSNEGRTSADHRDRAQAVAEVTRRDYRIRPRIFDTKFSQQQWNSSSEEEPKELI